jgi:hypothetical protein
LIEKLFSPEEDGPGMVFDMWVSENRVAVSQKCDASSAVSSLKSQGMMPIEQYISSLYVFIMYNM